LKVKPPSILYKYIPVEDWLPRLLTGESMLFSSRTTFNDPYDSRTAYQVDQSKAGKKWLLERFKLEQPHWSPAERILRANQVQQRLRSPSADSDEAMLDNVGILCLTEHWDNMLLWSHYANQHKGICVGFRTDIDFFRIAFNVDYVSEFPVIQRPKDDHEAIFQKALLTKAECWRYESEWRIIKRPMAEFERMAIEQQNAYLAPEDLRILTDHRGAGIYAFDKSAIESVTLGSRISEGHRADVSRSIESAGLHIPIYEVASPNRQYQLVRSNLKRL
jgi:hypothetical protein